MTSKTVFWDAIHGGGVSPGTYKHFWVEAGSMSSGGSKNQLELPRGANRFFEFNHSNYSTDNHRLIGILTLVIGHKSWDNRRLTWHGHNKMERLNLPTLSQGGLEYVGTAILFRRYSAGFEIEVADWKDKEAVAWRKASEAKSLSFHLGLRGDRVCGLF